jgi:hypothetical protein
MKKQVQFAILRVYGNLELNQALRAQIEEPLNNGWELNDWKPLGVWSKDEENRDVVNVMICLTRELDEEPAAKRGRPAKVDA